MIVTVKVFVIAGISGKFARLTVRLTEYELIIVGSFVYTLIVSAEIDMNGRTGFKT